jgi:hypothetical protein
MTSPDESGVHEDIALPSPGSLPAPQILAALYQATYLEISRLRDYEWRITYYFIALSLAGAGFAMSDVSVQPPT